MVVPEDEGGLQPLHAMYASSCLPILESVFARDFTPAIRELIFDGTTRFLDTELIERFGSPQTVFFNVNTPSDLKEADRILGHLE
jgi:molybdopterin-guanine dinucleotide biosynthesis protein A